MAKIDTLETHAERCGIADESADLGVEIRELLFGKRPALIPILDNQAIFGAYMNPLWPQRRSSQASVNDRYRIEQAIDWMARDLVREENATVWQELQAIEPKRTLIQILDSVWWMYVRMREPIRA